MARAHRDGLRSRTHAAVVPAEPADFNGFEMASEVGGVLDLATAGVEMAELFREFYRRHLATESWDFIAALRNHGECRSRIPRESAAWA